MLKECVTLEYAFFAKIQRQFSALIALFVLLWVNFKRLPEVDKIMNIQSNLY